MFRWLVIIPIVGGILVGVGGVAVLMMVFEEVDEIDSSAKRAHARSAGSPDCCEQVLHRIC
jgi:hypothetical protein